MATTKGGASVRRFMGSIPEQLRTRVLRGAARAAANVVADEAKLRSISPEVTSAIKVATKREADRMIAKVQVKGPGAFIAPWLEYGTSPHFISVDESQRGGRSVGRINRLANTDGNSHSLVIGGAFVGDTVFHPGARPHPFLRVSLDTKEGEAVAAAQAFINARVKRGGIIDGDDPGDDA